MGFALITALYRKKKFNGQVVMAYFAWYGFGRMFIEGLRTDSLYVGPFRISQVVGALCFVGGVAAIIICTVFVRRGKFLPQLAVCWAEDMPGETVDANEEASSLAMQETTDADAATPDTENLSTDGEDPAEEHPID